MKDLKQYKKFPEFLEGTPRIFDGYPRMAADIMAEMFVMNGEPAQPLQKKMMKHVKKMGIMTIAKDLWKGVRSL